MKQTDTLYGDYVISLCKFRKDEFTVAAWHKSQQSESDIEPALTVDGSFSNAIAAYIHIGESIAKAELQ